ncbi:MAG: class I SAM-dependent methyltransferase [Anaerolineales bacterium]
MNEKKEPVTINADIKRFDQWAATYDQSIAQRWFFGPVHTKMLKLLVREMNGSQPGSILDVGCGTGRLLRAALVHWPKVQLFGVDPAAQMISEATRLNPKATFKLAQAENLPFPDQSMDVVLTSISFHHWADHQQAVNEIARVLRPGGFFCLADHEFLLTKLWGEKVKSRREIRTLMMNAGLSVRNHRGMGIRFVHITLAQK